MHEVVQNEEKKESSRARSLLLLQTRTGPTASTVNKDEEEQVKKSTLSKEQEQQKRIAARAATAMAQVLHRRREPRSLLMWGDRKKAIIKNYPDGGQEIIVPQTLTPEQEHYEFPPRSRFLKKLATSTAERTRLSVLSSTQEDQVVPSFSSSPPLSLPQPTTASAIVPSHHYPTTTITSFIDQQPQQQQEMKHQQPDQLALQEWFSKKEVLTSQHLETRNSKTRPKSKDRVVIDWMNDVERSSKNLLSFRKNKHHQQIKPSPTPSSCNNSNKIQFKSDAGKRWASSITSNASLVPPTDDDASKRRKHYVPRRLLTLMNKRMKPLLTAKELDNEDVVVEQATQAASKIQQIWKDYQSTASVTAANSNNNTSRLAENQIGMSVMATTGQRTPMAGMVHLVQMLSDSLKVQQQRSHDRMQQLELLLKEETKKRKLVEEQSVVDISEKEKTIENLLFKVSELEKQSSTTSKQRARRESVLKETNLSKRRDSSRKEASSQSRKSPVVAAHSNNVTPSSSSRNRLQSSSLVSRTTTTTRKESIMAATSTTRRARTSSLANAGVIPTSCSSPKRPNTKVVVASPTPNTRPTRRMTVAPPSLR